MVKDIRALDVKFTPDPPLLEALLDHLGVSSGEDEVVGAGWPPAVGTDVRDLGRGLERVEWEVPEGLNCGDQLTLKDEFTIPEKEVQKGPKKPGKEKATCLEKKISSDPVDLILSDDEGLSKNTQEMFGKDVPVAMEVENVDKKKIAILPVDPVES